MRRVWDRRARRGFDQEHRRLLRIEAEEDRRAAKEQRRQERREDKRMRTRARRRTRPARWARRRAALSPRRLPDLFLQIVVGSAVGVAAAFLLVWLSGTLT